MRVILTVVKCLAPLLGQFTPMTKRSVSMKKAEQPYTPAIMVDCVQMKQFLSNCLPAPLKKLPLSSRNKSLARAPSLHCALIRWSTMKTAQHQNPKSNHTERPTEACSFNKCIEIYTHKQCFLIHHSLSTA